MKSRPKIASLDAHLAVRRKLSFARREAHAIGHVANVMLEIEREVARLDAKILEFEETIARLSDEHLPQRQRFKFLSLKVDLVVSDKKQLRELVAAMRRWRDLLVGEEGRRAIDAAKAFAAFLNDAGDGDDINEEPSPAPTGSDAPAPGRWG